MEEINLKDIFNMFWNRKWVIIFITLFFAVIGYFYTTNFVEPEYTSATTLVLVQADKSSEQKTTDSITTTDITLNSKLVSTYSELIKRKNILRTVLNNLDNDNLNIDEDELRKNIKVTAVQNTELIEIAVTNQNPTYAATIANETAKVFIQKVSDIYNINNINVVDKAEKSEKPSNINHKKDIILFAMLGIFIAFVYVTLINIFDNTVKTPEEIEKLTNLPVLSSIQLINKLKK